MKKLFIVGLAIVSAGSLLSASMSYECWAYKNDKPWKMTHVSANDKSQAVDRAWDKFKNLGVSPQFIRCK